MELTKSVSGEEEAKDEEKEDGEEDEGLTLDHLVRRLNIVNAANSGAYRELGSLHGLFDAEPGRHCCGGSGFMSIRPSSPR